MEIELNNNLHPKYKLIGNDVELMKQFVSNMSLKELFTTIPVIAINKNAIFYNNSLDSIDIGSSPATKNNFKKFTFDIDLAENKKEITHVYYNKEELQVLDFTQVDVAVGFNVLDFMVDGEEFRFEEKKIVDYCRDNKLDGYITLTPHRRYANCYSTGNGSSICPTIYLRNRALENLILLGLIHLKRKRELTYDELLILNNLLFCNINNLFDININIKTEAIIKHIVKNEPSSFSRALYHTVQFMFNDKEYDLSTIFNTKGMLSILDLSSANLGEECGFQFYEGIEDIDSININEKYDVITGKEIDTSVADKLMDAIFENIANEYGISAFLMNNYETIAEIEGYEPIIEYVNNAPGIDEVKGMFVRLEQDIVYRLRQYKKSDIDFINLQLLKTTYDYITKNIVDAMFRNDIEEVINILNGIELKQYNFLKLFKVDLLVIDISYKKLYKHKIIYQTLLNDVALVVQKPSIHLEMIKYLAILDNNNIYKEAKQKVYSSIYDVYKNYLKGLIDFNSLNVFLETESIYNFIYYIANNNNIQINLLQQYNDLIQLPLLKDAVKSIKDMDMETLKEYLDTLSTYIITAKIAQSVSEALGLNIGLNTVKNFISKNVGDYLVNQINDRKSAFNDIKNNVAFDYYQFIKEPLGVGNVIDYIESVNTNEEMIEYIYKDLKIPLHDKDKVLKLLKGKKLYDIYISYLQEEITKEELKKLVSFTFEKEEEKRPRRESNEKKSNKREKRRRRQEEEEEEDEDTDEM